METCPAALVAYQWTLPWPKGVTTNHLYVRTRWGGVRLSPAALAWKNTVIVTVRQSLTAMNWKVEPPLGPKYAFTVHAFPPNLHQHDPDNLLKLAQDAVMEALGTNDRKVFHVEATLHVPDRKNPHLLVRLDPWEEG